MTWLLKLYPRPWRRRYGDEVAAIVAEQPFSIALVIDLIAGALDVWLHPDVTMAAATTSAAGHNAKTTGGRMLTQVLRLDCAAGFSKRELWLSTIATIGGTILLTLAWMWLHLRIGDNPYTDSFSVLAFILPMLLGMRFTYLKDKPFSVYIAFVVTMSALVAAVLAMAAWISSLL